MGLFDRVRAFLSSKFGTSTSDDRQHSTSHYRTRQPFNYTPTRSPTSSLYSSRRSTSSLPTLNPLAKIPSSDYQVNHPVPVLRCSGRFNIHGSIKSVASSSSTANATKHPLNTNKTSQASTDKLNYPAPQPDEIGRLNQSKLSCSSTNKVRREQTSKPSSASFNTGSIKSVASLGSTANATKRSANTVMLKTHQASAATLRYPAPHPDIIGHLNEHKLPYSSSKVTKEHTSKLCSAASFNTGSTANATKRPLTDTTMKTSQASTAKLSYLAPAPNKIGRDENCNKVTCTSKSSTSSSTAKSMKQPLTDATLKVSQASTAKLSYPAPQIGHLNEHKLPYISSNITIEHTSQLSSASFTTGSIKSVASLGSTANTTKPSCADLYESSKAWPQLGRIGCLNEQKLPYSSTNITKEHTCSALSSAASFNTTSTANATKRPLTDTAMKTSQASTAKLSFLVPDPNNFGRDENKLPCSSSKVTHTSKLTSASGSTANTTKQLLTDATLKTSQASTAKSSHPLPRTQPPNRIGSLNVHNEWYTGNFNAVPSIPPQSSLRYSVKDLTFKLESSPKDRSFTPQSNTVYHNQWTTCNAIVTHESTTELVNKASEVEITSASRIQFRNIKLVNGRLQFSMKASDAANCATIIFTINKHCVITKDVCVNFNPPSSVLSEITIRELREGNYRNREDEFNLRVSIIDVFGDSALRNSEKNCVLDAIVSESGGDEEIEKRICPGEHLHFDLSTKSELWSKKLQVFLNGKEVAPAQKFEVTDEDRDAILKYRSEALEDEYDEYDDSEDDEYDEYHDSDEYDEYDDSDDEYDEYDDSEDDDFKSIPDCLVFDNSRVFIPTPEVHDRKFVPFDNERCQIQSLPGGGYKLICKDTSKHVILGADCAHINNIKRVLQLKERLEIKENATQTSIIFDHGNVTLHDLRTCKEVVLHLLRGSYYREKASEAARARMEWKKRMEELDEITNVVVSATVQFCKFFKDHFGDLMNKYNREACEELFSFFNYNRDGSEVDLHGLLVADEKRLEALRLNILSGNLSDEKIEDIIRKFRLKPKSMKKNLMAGRLAADQVNQFINSSEVNCYSGMELETLRTDLLRRCDRSKEVDELIKKWRAESDEAIRKLKETLDNFDLDTAVENNSPWIEIIVGAGHHSRKKEKQNIRPKVEKLLKERGNKFIPVNKGSLVVTFIEYSGPQPCFGEYYCVQCDRCWKSSKSFTGKYQKCSRCLFNCWPIKQREKERTVNFRREGEEGRRKSKPHQSSLCQKCQELGYPCNEEDF